MKKQPACPECEKLVAVSEESNKIGSFLNWMYSQRIVLSRYGHANIEIYDEDEQEYIRADEMLYPANEYRGDSGINRLLALYFEIDLDKVEQERRALLEWLREAQS